VRLAPSRHGGSRLRLVTVSFHSAAVDPQGGYIDAGFGREDVDDGPVDFAFGPEAFANERLEVAVGHVGRQKV